MVKFTMVVGSSNQRCDFPIRCMYLGFNDHFTKLLKSAINVKIHELQFFPPPHTHLLFRSLSVSLLRLNYHYIMTKMINNCINETTESCQMQFGYVNVNFFFFLKMTSIQNYSLYFL